MTSEKIKQKENKYVQTAIDDYMAMMFLSKKKNIKKIKYRRNLLGEGKWHSFDPLICFPGINNFTNLC